MYRNKLFSRGIQYIGVFIDKIMRWTMRQVKGCVKILRIHHHIKNLLILLPLMCSGNLLRPMYFGQAILGFLTFSLMASAVYIINDIQDIHKDMMHPIKRTRPLPNGDISITLAWRLVIALVFSAIIVQSVFMKVASAGIWIGIYMLLNILYSVSLKHVPFVDILILVSGFLFRVLYGGAILNIEISSWLYLTVIAASFYLALGKRRNELLKMGGGGESRDVLKGYTFNFLDRNMYMCAALAIVFYSLWCIDIKTIGRMTLGVIWSVPLVMILFMRYSFDIEKDSFGDPVEVVFHDKILLLLTAFNCGYLLFLLYCK